MKDRSPQICWEARDEENPWKNLDVSSIETIQKFFREGVGGFNADRGLYKEVSQNPTRDAIFTRHVGDSKSCGWKIPMKESHIFIAFSVSFFFFFPILYKFQVDVFSIGIESVLENVKINSWVISIFIHWLQMDFCITM